MLDVLEPVAAAARIEVPSVNRRPIAIVGAGAIVDYAHLPAYRKVDLEVVGLFDIDQDRAREVAARHGGVRTFSSLQGLLETEAEVIDIAVVPWAQPEIAEEALDSGKHLLCQKPLALDLETAERLVASAAAHGRKLAVNQQMRFEEGIAAARAMVDLGWIGEPTSMAITVNIDTDWSAWPWLVESDRLDLMYHSIHYFDSIRSIFQDPELVWSSAGRTPGQLPKGETRTVSTLVFGDGRLAVVHTNHENVAGDAQALFRIEGSEGAIRGTLGLLYDYPHGRPDTLEVWSRSLPTDGWLVYPVTTRWIPDAFAGPLASLLRAIAEDGEPITSGTDNLNTLRLIHALYRSIATGQAQRLTG
jgi:predicted dehydrogenase